MPQVHMEVLLGKDELKGDLSSKALKSKKIPHQETMVELAQYYMEVDGDSVWIPT